MQAPTHDHLRNWEFIVIKDKKEEEEEEEEEEVLQFVKLGIAPTLEVLEKTLTNGTPQQKNVC